MGMIYQMIKAGLVIGDINAKEMFWTRILPALAKDGGEIREEFGWSKETVQKWLAIPAKEWKTRIPNPRPGELTLRARFSNGAEVKPGTVIEHYEVDTEAGELKLEEKWAVREIREVSEGSYDFYGDEDKHADGVDYVGRTKDGRLVLDVMGFNTKFLEQPGAAKSIRIPPPPKQSAWSKFEAKLGFPFPKALKAIFSRREGTEAYMRPRFEDLSTFDDAFPAMSSRFVPLINEGQNSGDCVGLFFPRGGGEPFLATWYLSESQILPLTANLAGFAEDPDAFPAFSDAELEEPKPAVRRRRAILRSKGGKPWESLLANPKARVPEHELLKQLCLQRSEFDGESAKTFFAGFNKGFGAKDAVSALVRKHLKTVADFRNRLRWRALAIDLWNLGEKTKAMNALENGIGMEFIYVPKQSRKDEERDCWETVREFLPLLQGWAQEAGDTLEQTLLEVHRAWLDKDEDDDETGDE